MQIAEIKKKNFQQQSVSKEWKSKPITDFLVDLSHENMFDSLKIQ